MSADKITLVREHLLTFAQNDDVTQRTKLYVAAFFTIGLFNNNGYVLVAGGAEELAKDFGKINMMPAFQL